MLQYTKKLNPAVFVPTFFLVILEIAKTFSSILLPQYFIDDITNRSSIRQTMFHLAILIIAIFGIQIFRAAITPYILKAYNQGDANTALDYAFHYVKMEYKDQENDEIRNTQEKLRRNVTANGFVADDLSGFFINLFLVIGFSFIMVRLHVLIYLVFFVIAICNYERLSSTHFCDRIIVINNGTVFEDGTHQSLMAKESGIYKKMFTTQAAHYFSDPTTVAVVD